MRLFLAVFPSTAAQAQAERAIDALHAAPGGRDVAWVRRQNLHYTLRFLGEVDEVTARLAGEAAAEAARSQPPFEAAIAGAGAFPSPDRARVLWLGLRAGEAPLRALAAALEGALESRGLGRDAKPFTPHLTIGRVRGRDADWGPALAAAPAIDAAFRVDRLLLVRSTLAPGGARYEVIREAPLAG